MLERGLQGMPKLPGLKPRVGDSAHAVALGKVVLALAGPEVVDRYARNPGLRRFTPYTITDRERLRAELAATVRPGLRDRARGVRRGLLLHRRAGARRAAGASSR